MAVDREGLFSALFTRLQTQLGTNIQSYTRRPMSWDDALPVDQPALLLVKGNERVERKGQGFPIVWMLKAEIWLYVKDDGTNEAVPSTVLNQLLTLIEKALEVQPGEQTLGMVSVARLNQPPASTTLGGLCLACEIVGDVEIAEGVQGHTAMLKVPLEITAPA